MSVLSIRRRPPVWIALLAMLWQLLLPWSPALANDALAGELIPVCTSTGLKWIALDDGGSIESTADSERKHCPLCWFEHQPPALQATQDSLVYALVVTRTTVVPFEAPLAGTELGVPPPIRAPPSRS